MTYLRYFRIFMFVSAGIVVGVMFAKFKTQDYHHASIMLKKGVVVKPLQAGNYDGRQVFALSMKNLQGSKNIGIKMDGAEIQSWYPPVVKMPFYKWMDVNAGEFHGIDFGKRLPIYLITDKKKGCGEIEIFDLADGSLIQKVHVMRGGADAGPH